MRLPPVRLISFDLDDTLVDTDGAAEVRLSATIERLRHAGLARHAREWNAALDAGLSCDPVIEGRLAPLLAALRLEPRGEEARVARETYDAALFTTLRVFDDVAEVLAALRPSYRIAIVTNGAEAIQRWKLTLAGLDRLVDVVAISEVVGSQKPAREIFEYACAAVNVSPTEAVHVGDSLTTDVAGAQGAGLLSIWRRPARGPLYCGDVSPAATIDRLHDLLALL